MHEQESKFVSTAKSEFEQALESAAGESIDSLRDMPIDERRRMIEERLGRLMEFPSLYPIIGVGGEHDVWGPALSRKEIDAKLAEIGI